MDKDKSKKPSTYEMLKKLDKRGSMSRSSSSRRGSYSSRSSSNYRKRRSESPRSYEDSKKSSRKDSPPEIVLDDDIDYDVPDRSNGDLYCKACDSHMNSELMWEAHITGKRHQKSVKKGESDLKYDIVEKDPLFLSELKKTKETLIGLQHCCEIQRIDGKPIYQCFLCSANLHNGQMLIEHVVGVKHRMQYLKVHDIVKHDLISATDLKKGVIDSVVADCIQLHYEKYGSGRLQVKVERPKPPGPTYSNYQKNYKDEPDQRKPREERKSYSDEKHDDHDWRQMATAKERDYQRSRYENDLYEEKYSRPSEAAHNKSNYYPEYEREFLRSNRDDSYGLQRPPSPQKRPFTPPPTVSKLSYNDNIPETKTHAQHSQSSSWNQPIEQSQTQDLRVLLEQRKSREMNKNQNTPGNMFEQILHIFENIPTVLFLELVLHRVETLNPTDSELPMLQEIGNHMISIVMKRKLKNLTPDILNKFQQNVDYNSLVTELTNENREAESNQSSNLNHLMDWIGQIKSSSQPSTWEQTPQPDFSSKCQGDEPTFMTQSSGPSYNKWGTAPATSSASNYEKTGIPGLTLTATNEQSSTIFSHTQSAMSQPTYTQPSLPQRPQDPISNFRSSWSSNEYKNYYDNKY